MTSVWEVSLRRDGPNQLELRPTLAGIHAVVAHWLHAPAGSVGPGEKHESDHKYSVSWHTPQLNVLVLRLVVHDPKLEDVLLARVRPGRAELLGKVDVVVESLALERRIELSSISGIYSRHWSLEFPNGITFRSGSLFSPWPSPERILGSITRRGRDFFPLEGATLDLSKLLSGIVVTSVELSTVTHWAGGSSVSDLRQINAARGRLQWSLVGEAERVEAVGYLLSMGSILGVGAMTAWGLGRMEVYPMAHKAENVSQVGSKDALGV